MHRDKPSGQRTAPGRGEDTLLRVKKQHALPGGLAEEVLAVLPYSMAVLDQQGTIVAVNAAWKRFACDNGAPALADGSVGVNYLAVCLAAAGPSTAGAQEALVGIRAVLEGSRSLFTLEYPCHSPSERRWFLLHAAPLPSGRGGAVVSHVDITERTQLAQALAEQKRVFDSLLAVSPDHIFLLDPTGRFVYVNPAAVAVIVAANGRPADEIVGRTARELELPPEFVVQFEEQQAQARAGHMAVAETPFPGPQGVRQYEYVLSPMYTEDGRLEALAGITRDVEERRRLERRTQEALGALLDMAQALTSPDEPADSRASAPDTSAVTRRVAEAARSVLGVERILLTAVDPETDRLYPLARVGGPLDDEPQWYAEAGQFRLGDYLSPDLLARLRAGEVIEHALQGAAQRGLPTHGVHRVLVAPLRVGADLVGVLALDDGATPRIFTAAEHDLVGATAHLVALVLQRDRLCREREEAGVRERTLQETTQRLDEFLATASHDLRSPVTVTLAALDFATRRFERLAQAVLAQAPALGDAVEGVRRSLADAGQGVDRLAGLVALLFDTAQMRAGTLQLHPVPCDLAAIVREAVEALRLAHPQRTIDLSVAAKEPVPVVAEANRLGQVAMNYLTNALKYSPEDQAVAVRLEGHGEMVRVAMTDHGPGLPPSEQSHIWQRFYRAQGIEVQSGSDIGLGLGLHICKTIVEAHGGQVGVESKVGQGSTFWFTLPLASAA